MEKSSSSPAGTLLAENGDDAYFATTLAKGLLVLEAFDIGATVLGNAEVAQRTGLPRPTVARLTHTLAALGYLRHDARLAKYRPGAQALRMARPLLAGLPFRQVARPLMHELAENVRGTVSIGLLDGTSMVYVESARSGHVGPHAPDIGLPIPVILTAMGRAAAAILPPGEAARLEERLKREDASLWSARRDRYRAGVRDCADRGFGTCPGEYMPSIHAVAAPLFYSRDLGQAFAINCGIPAFRLKSGQLEAEIGPRIKALAASIRALVGEAEPAMKSRDRGKRRR